MELDSKLVRDTMGHLEMRLVKAVEQRRLAFAAGDVEDVERLKGQIAVLHLRLAETAEVIATAVITDEGHRYPAKVLVPEEQREGPA